MKVTDIELFAAAVVSSSKPDSPVQEKLTLFLEAKKIAKEHNRNVPLTEASITKKPDYL